MGRWVLPIEPTQELIFSGPGYRTDTVFDLSRMQPYNLLDLLKPFQQFTPNVALYLPRTSDLRQLTESHKGDNKLTVIHYCMEGASKVRIVQANHTWPILIDF